MGEALCTLVNERDTGFQLEAPECEACEQVLEFVNYRGWRVRGLEGDTRLKRVYYVCSKCDGQTLFPLDHKLKLRHDPDRCQRDQPGIPPPFRQRA